MRNLFSFSFFFSSLLLFFILMLFLWVDVWISWLSVCLLPFENGFNHCIRMCVCGCVLVGSVSLCVALFCHQKSDRIIYQIIAKQRNPLKLSRIFRKLRFAYSTTDFCLPITSIYVCWNGFRLFALYVHLNYVMETYTFVDQIGAREWEGNVKTNDGIIWYIRYNTHITDSMIIKLCIPTSYNI